jgi:hypothetical protein
MAPSRTADAEPQPVNPSKSRKPMSNRIPNLAIGCLLLGLALIGAGCSSVEVRSKVNVYNDTVKNYAKLLRWGFYEDAYAYHRLKDGEAELDEVDFEALKDVRVTKLVMKSKSMDEDTMEGEIGFSLDYYNNYTGYVHSLSVRQDWWFDPGSETWHIDEQFPSLR